MTFTEIAKRRKGLIVGAALVLSGAWAAISGPQGLQNLLEKRREIRELEEHNAALVEENKERRLLIQKLSGSPAEQEIVIRDQLKLAKPGETTFILPTPAPETSTKPESKSGEPSR